MMQKTLKKVLFSIVLVTIMIFGVMQSTIHAVTTQNISLVASRERYVNNNGVFQKKNAYVINGTDDYPIYQIGRYEGNTLKAINYYCLNAAKTLSENVSNPTTYNKGYDMVSEKSAIAGLNSNYSATVSNDAKYKAVMWILDHMYVEGGDLTIENLLANAGIVYGRSKRIEEPVIYNWKYNSEEMVWYWGFAEYMYTDPSDNTIKDVVLSKEEVEAVQQAAIWYFTNNIGGLVTPITRDLSTDSSGEEILNSFWFQYTESTTGDTTTDKKIKQMKQEQASILYNYLINGGNSATSYNPSEEGTLNLAYASTERIVEEGSNYVIGPMVATTTGTVGNLSVEVTTGANYGTTIQNPTLRNASRATISTITSGQNFYVVVPKTSVNGSVKVTVSTTSTTTKKTLWVSDSAENQAVVEVEKKTTPLKKELTATPDVRLFDLALRKKIEAVNGKKTATTIVNESGLDARRLVTPDTSTIPVTATATYNHRKDPVVVKTGNTVTYRIYIYNEGQIDGYASKIVDTLATGLVKSSEMGTTVRSHKGNTYNVTTSGNKITLELTNANPTAISAYSSELDYDYIDVLCDVEQVAETDGSTKHYLSNIAYIEEAKNKDGEVITQDRNGTESKPGNTDVTNNSKGLNVTNKNDIYHGSTNKSIFNNTSNSSDYFAGQEDDDDFETVVILPKEFDLKLIKYISEVNGNSSNRTVTVNTANLNKVVNGKKVTTADYQVSKVPVTVQTGDIIKYTFRVYNEGEVAGYAEEITEDIPEGLEYIETADTTKEQEAKTFNDGMLWEVGTRESGKVKTIKTSYLSKARSTDNLIAAYTSGEPKYKEVSVMLKVTSTDVKNIIRNEAEISKDKDDNGNDVTDRDSVPEEWKKENSDDLYENNPSYPKYKEDDEDYDNIKLARFDIALRKFISAVSKDGNFNNTSTTTRYDRAPEVETSKLNTKDSSGEIITTAEYEHSKQPVVLDIGDFVEYTIRVYNEGDLDGYAKEITDYLPEYLDFITGSEYTVNNDWIKDPNSNKITTKPTAEISNKKLTGYNGTGELDYTDVKIICQINDKAVSTKKITNIAEISKYADENGEREEDIDSTRDNLDYPTDESTYKDTEIDRGDKYIQGQEDDDDFEKVIVRGPGKYDVILIKEDETGEQLNEKATFEVNGVTKEVTGYLVIADDVEINAKNVNTPDVYTIIETIAPDEYCEFDGTIKITANKKADGMTYSLDGNLVYEVTDKDGKPMDTTDAKVYLKDGNIYVEVIDYEKKNFDLALRKFITDIAGEKVTSRIPEVSYKDGKITYTHPKDVLKVHVGDVVTYTLRVFNEGQINGYAQTITDDIPEYLEYLPENETNIEYKWVMYDKDGNVTEDVENAVKIVTDYTSKENGEDKNLLKAFNPNASISEENPNYLDVKVAFKVKDPNSNKYIIENKAQISDDADEDGNPIDDIDSIPDEWNDGEDDQDYENVSVEYFDLALLKYVTKVIVTDQGKTKTTNTGNTGSDKDIVPKVEIHKNRVKTTVVKFEYTIKITNEGDIAGYAKEITDYVPQGLKFYSADNTGWKDEGNNVISTKLLENTLLQPGESATVKVVLRWINGSSNLGVKINTAEISEDYNEKEIPDKDSTPDNKKPGEDDIDDAPVLVSMKTGLAENPMLYIGGGLAVLIILGTGIVLIKKFVL